MKQVLAHIRKSTHGRDENGCERQEGSFDRQKNEVVDYAEKHEMEIVRWYEEAVTGKSVRKRKVFLQMVRDVQRPGCPYKDILFGAYDRFMRDVHEAWRYELELMDAGIKLHFSNLKNDGSDQEEMYKDMYRRMAANYSRDLAVKVLQGMIRKAKMGCWLGGIAPYGFRTRKDLNGNTWLIVYEEEAKVVRIIFDWSLKGWGHKKIAIWLNQQGIPASETARKRNSTMNKNPDGRWSGNSVRMLLRNPVYKGVARWNKRSRVDCFEWELHGQGTVELGKLRTESAAFLKNGGQSVKRSDREFYVDRIKEAEKWIVGKAPVIVSEEIFDTVQQRFTSYSSKRWRRMNHAKHLMGGALLCKVCGNKFYGHRYRKTIKTTGEDAFYEFYRCYGDSKKGSHSSGTVSIMIKLKTLDSVVVDGIIRRIQHLIDQSRIKDLFRQKVKEFLNDKPDRLAQLEKDIKKVSGEIERMIYAYRKFETAIPEDKVKELKDRQKILESQKDGLIASGYANIVRNIDYEVGRFLENLGYSGKTIEFGDYKERIRIREAFLEKAEFWYNGDRPEVKLFWRKIAKFFDQPQSSTSTTPIANWLFADEGYDIETYVYEDSQLVLVPS